MGRAELVSGASDRGFEARIGIGPTGALVYIDLGVEMVTLREALLRLAHPSLN